jgi:hypothetical protein
MGLPQESVDRLAREYPGIAVLARERGSASAGSSTGGLYGGLYRSGYVAPRPVLAVRVPVEGVVGGHSQTRCRYELIVETTDLQRAIPPIWVTSPPDEVIKHVNIWPTNHSFCRWAGRNLPSLCWNTFNQAWLRAPHTAQRLGNALELARQLLNAENHDSPAR